MRLQVIALTCLLILLVACSGEPPLVPPDYPLFVVSKEESYSKEELDKIAIWFSLMHGHLSPDEMAYLQEEYPDFQVMAHINSSYSKPGEVTQVEKELREAIAMYWVADLSEKIDASQTRFRLEENGQTSLSLRASTVDGDFSSSEGSTQKYVTWLRLDDELMKVVGWDPDTKIVEVTRGFSGSNADTHAKKTAVLSPVYIGVKGKHWAGYYPGGPNTDLRYALRQDHELSRAFKVQSAIERLKQGEANGIWWDIMSAGFFNQSNMMGEAVLQWNFEAGHTYTRPEYRDHLQGKVQYFHDVLARETGRNVPMVGNNFSGTYYPEDGNDRLQLLKTEIKPDPLVGLVFEGFPGEFLKEHFRVGESMLRSIRIVMDLEERGLPGLLSYDNCASRRATTPEEAALKEQFEEYGYASFLMGVVPQGTVKYGIAAYRRPSASNLEPSLWLHPQYFYGIGKPVVTVAQDDLEELQIPGHLTLCREFERAFVFVNVSEAESDQIRLADVEGIGRGLYNPKTQAMVEQLEVGPHTGVILLKSAD